jgi:hypothetical protein
VIADLNLNREGYFGSTRADVSRSIFGPRFSEQTEVDVRRHALESGCFVVNSTAWLDTDQQAHIMKDRLA